MGSEGLEGKYPKNSGKPSDAHCRSMVEGCLSQADGPIQVHVRAHVVHTSGLRQLYGKPLGPKRIAQTLLRGLGLVKDIAGQMSFVRLGECVSASCRGL